MFGAILVCAAVALSAIGGIVTTRLWAARTARWARRPSPLLPVYFGLMFFAALCILTGWITLIARVP